MLGEVIFRKPAMGEGDVKFAGFIGAFCGWQGAVFAMFGGALLGTVILLPYLLFMRLVTGRGADCIVDESENEDNEGEGVQFGMQVPFGPMLAGAGLIYFLGFNAYVDAYFAEYISYFFGSK